MRYRLPLILLFVLPATVAVAEISARLSANEIEQHSPVQLTIELVNANPGIADLTPLEQDFFIQHRSRSQNSRYINGRSSQRTVITLSLLPRRSGQLSIPPLNFGTSSTQPLQLAVLASDVPSGEAFVSTADSSMPQMPPPWAFGMPGPAMGGTPAWWNAPLSVQDAAASNPPETPAQVYDNEDVPSGSDTNYWMWAALLAMSGWLITSLILLRGRRWPTKSTGKTGAEPVSEILTPEPVPDPHSAIEAVHRAYADKDTYAAQQALLDWAAIRWPQNPPTNLSRLAARCPEHLQRHLLTLDQALYSPEPMDWSSEPVWDLLPMEESVLPAKEDEDLAVAASK